MARALARELWRLPGAAMADVRFCASGGLVAQMWQQEWSQYTARGFTRDAAAAAACSSSGGGGGSAPASARGLCQAAEQLPQAPHEPPPPSLLPAEALCGLPVDDAALPQSAASWAASAAEGASVDGPVAAAMQLLDALHSSVGLPWWAAICGYAIGIRIATLPLSLYQAKAAAMTLPLLSQARSGSGAAGEAEAEAGAEAPAPPRQRPSLAEVRSRFEQLRELHGAPSPWWIIAAPVVQIPVFVSSILAVRRLCVLGASGLEHGGALWFRDLSQPAVDWLAGSAPLGPAGVLLPLLVATAFAQNVERACGVGAAAATQGSRTALLAQFWLRRVGALLALASVPVLLTALSVPHGVALYWATSSAVSLAMGRALALPAVKQYMGIPVAPGVPAPLPPLGREHGGGGGGGGGGAAEDAIRSIRCYSPEEAATEEVDPRVAALVGSETEVDALFWKAAMLRSKGRLADAVHCLQRVVELEPDNARAHFALGQLHSRARQWDASEEAYLNAAALEKEPAQQARAWFGAGVALRQQGETATALQALAKAEAVGAPGTVLNALLARAALLREAGRLAEAESVLRRAAALDAEVAARFLAELQEEATAGRVPGKPGDGGADK